MAYAKIDASYSVPPPQPELNGGWYTGEPFAKGAPYRNFPVIPDSGFMTHHNLRSALPPIEALYQYTSTIRPGNNYSSTPGLRLNTKYNIMCNELDCGQKYYR